MDANNKSQRLQGQVGRDEHDHDLTLASREGVGNKSGGPAGNVPAGQVFGGSATFPSAGNRGADPSPPIDRADGGLSPLAQMHQLMLKAGEEPFDKACIASLSGPLDDSMVDIRPDGLLYVSHPHYRDRLDAAFDVGGWSLIPLEKPQIMGNKVYYHAFLKARGRYVGDAYGEAAYFPNNTQGSYGNSVEAAKSDCLVRCCKLLPMFRQLWDKEYCDYWVSTYTEKGVSPQSGNKIVWKKKGTAMRDFTMRPDRQSVGEYSRPSRLTDEQNSHLEAIAREDRLLLSSKDEYEDRQEYSDDGRE